MADETAGSGPAEPGLSGVDLARVALRAAREQARERGAQQGSGRVPTRRAGARGGRGEGRDPQSLGSAIVRLIAERGWEAPAAVGGVMGRWPEIVGPEVAGHCVPEHFDEEAQVLAVRCSSTAWATQLRLLAPQLVSRLNQDLGRGTVRSLRVQGPAAPVRRYGGPLRAPGSKGAGDTWG